MSGPILRSWLFVPANHSRRVEKALGLEADAVILDLEDAVAASEKGTARQMAREALSLPRHPRLYIRVNGLDTGLALDDLEAVVRPGLDGVMIPKVESARDVHIAAWLLGQLQGRHGLEEGTVELVALVETARGVERAAEVAAALPAPGRIAFGAIDYSLDLGVSHAGAAEALGHARARLAVTCRAAGLEPPVDTVYPDIRDGEGLEREARQARALGFGGKLVIHPDQIAPVNRVFSPSPEEVAWARRVVEAFTAAEEAGCSSIQVEGKFIDYPVAARARRVLALARAAGAREE
ncbi:MAG: CoA ester lyase [Bacillota bacterium]